MPSDELLVEPVPDGEDVDWAYQTPKSAPDRGLELAPPEVATLSPSAVQRLADPSMPPRPTPVDLGWERMGYLVFIGGVGSLATSGLVLVAFGMWFWLQ